MEYYELSPCHYFSIPGLSLDAMLKMTGIELELISDTDIMGVATEGGQGGHGSPNSISKPNKVQQFQLQTSEILLFTGSQKLYVPEILRFLPCILQFLNNLRQLFNFSNHIRGNRALFAGPSEKLWHLTLNLLKIFLWWIIRKRQ